MNNIAYICSPYRGNFLQVIRNKKYARKLTKMVIKIGLTPIATHLYLTQVLNDKNTKERSQGLAAGQEILKLCDIVIVGTKYGISSGMAAEIEAAKSKYIIYTL